MNNWNSICVEVKWVHPIETKLMVRIQAAPCKVSENGFSIRNLKQLSFLDLCDRATTNQLWNNISFSISFINKI